MTAPVVTALELRLIDKVLEMESGYVLDFSDRTFATFFQDYGVEIDKPRYSAEGTSKAKRLRYFLRNTAPPLPGRVLAGLLEYRLTIRPDGLDDGEVEKYRQIVTRLGGKLAARPVPGSRSDPESELLRRVFDKTAFARLPVDAALANALVGRMEEARRCIESESHLAAVILCGSVLEGMCLAFGTRFPERTNRAFTAQYNRPPPQFHEWKLRDWIDVLGRLGALSPNIAKFGHALRDFRNYVHPAEQLANRFTPDAHTARIGFQVVVAAVEDLARAAAEKGRA